MGTQNPSDMCIPKGVPFLDMAFTSENEQYGGLNKDGSHRLTGSGTIRRCGLVGEIMSLGVGFEVSEAQTRLMAHCLFLLPVNPDVELPVTSLAPCLPACLHGLLAMTIME
ncbi:hypothetical protein I79_009899 [Cricetulus griseus]|uniref:Uncharacterized protein n=1 Tax=Cricetulus griseus TaxID=10029 RepID=G3HH05_CRIGR|nr:hypothetical protein I79_009899 [Cricetulus griseus]